ncbi:hypothetical protein BDZ94DRAFT_420635 [Collybia nuda]|uniref:Uncharacterized protein n=1 Tax=Collybia nuda TaxID=64659 RepID=A0A9P5XV20_9AGAR|nr:hypothetical protein BDZ94DRAFT_420635 [Collybia nuda]
MGVVVEGSGQKPLRAPFPPPWYLTTNSEHRTCRFHGIKMECWGMPMGYLSMTSDTFFFFALIDPWSGHWMALHGRLFKKSGLVDPEGLCIFFIVLCFFSLSLFCFFLFKAFPPSLFSYIYQLIFYILHTYIP